MTIDVSSTVFRTLSNARSYNASLEKQPKLVIIYANNSKPCEVYINKKFTCGQDVGVKVELQKCDISIREDALIDLIREYNSDEGTDGILVQLPLPEHINTANVLSAVALHKDVDGMHPRHLGMLYAGTPRIIPCTCLGIMNILKGISTSFRGKRTALLGARGAVGRPMVHLLTHMGCTVTGITTDTVDVKSLLRGMDIIVSAIGVKHYITPDMVGYNTTVIDVGITTDAEGVHGDVDPAVHKVTPYCTPVPGGVGPMTVASVMTNLMTLMKARNAY